MQIILDARHSMGSVGVEGFDVVTEALSSTECTEDSPQRCQPISTPKPFTVDEIVGQAFLFLVAGHEIITNTLSFITYLLATHPDCQERLLKEVDLFMVKHVSTVGSRCSRASMGIHIAVDSVELQINSLPKSCSKFVR